MLSGSEVPFPRILGFFSSVSVKDSQNVLRLQRVITPRHSIGFQCNLVYEQTICVLVVALKNLTCSFRFCTILAFLKNGNLQITRLVLGCKSKELELGYFIKYRN